MLAYCFETAEGTLYDQLQSNFFLEVEKPLG